MKIILLIFILLGIGSFGICIVIGGNKYKSKREQIQEDEEQMNYLKNVKIMKKM